MRRQPGTGYDGYPESGLEPVGIDTPAFFDFEYFVRTTVREVVQRESSANPNIRAYAATLLVRLEEALQDPIRIHLQDLVLRGSAGVIPSACLWCSAITQFPEGATALGSSYESEHPRLPPQHQVTILDLSRLASDVLENVTALLGRLILEFMQRCQTEGGIRLYSF